MFKNIPFNRVEWVTSGFLIFTAILTVTAVPYYLWTYGWDWFLFGVFLFFYISTGMSITVGYHRLFPTKLSRQNGRSNCMCFFLELLLSKILQFGGVRNTVNTTSM